MRRRWYAMATLALAFGCGDGDGDADDVAEVKKALPLEQVPAAVLKTAREKAPGLTFFAAYSGKHQGKDSIELKGKTKSGQVKEMEIAPDGQFLGTE